MTLALAAEILSACAVYALLVAWVAHDRRRADRQSDSLPLAGGGAGRGSNASQTPTQQDKTP